MRRRTITLSIIIASATLVALEPLRERQSRASTPAALMAVQAAPVEIAPGRRTIHAPPQRGEVRALAIKQLGNFEYDPDHGGDIPADVQRLDGLTVRMTGYMVPMNQADRVTRFGLVPSLTDCCYGKPPTIQHTINVVCPSGVSLAYTNQPIIVQGKLHVGQQRENGFVISIFQMTLDKVVE